MKHLQILIAIISITLTCISCSRPKLAGTWKLTLPTGFEHQVTIQDMGKNQFYLRKDSGLLNMSGIYMLKKDMLIMLKPTDKRLTEFMWRVKDDESLILIEEPPAAKTGAHYLGATLVRVTNPPTNSPSSSQTQDKRG